MSDSEISQLPELAATPAVDDEFVVVDKSDTTDAPTGTTKRITSTNARSGLTGANMVSGVSLWWFDAGGNASAARPAQAASTDVVIWTNTPSEPTNLGARDQWEDAG